MNLIDLLELGGLGLVLLIFALYQRKWTLAVLPGALLLGCIGMAVLQFGLLDGRARAQVPAYQPVTDLTASLSASQQQALTTQLKTLERVKGSQLAVLIVPSTGGESIEQFSLRVAETWQLGRKDLDDGVLLLLARDDRSLRIEVGYGLEGLLTDALCSRIIHDSMLPLLRQGNVHAAIQAGVERISAVIQGKPLPASSPAPVASVASAGDVPVLSSPPPASELQPAPAPGGPSFGGKLSRQERDIAGVIIIALVVSFLCGPVLGCLPVPLAARAVIAGLLAAGVAGYVLQDPLLALGCGVGSALLCASRDRLGSSDSAGSSSRARSGSSSSGGGGGGRFGGGGSSGGW